MIPTIQYCVGFPYTHREQQALFQLAHAEDAEQGGRYDARSVAINVYTHPWRTAALRAESSCIGTFYFRWGDTPGLWEIEADDGFSLEDLCRELGTLELKALGRLKHGDPTRMTEV